MNNDLISREALKKRFDDYIKANPNISGIFELGKFIIDTAPTVTPTFGLFRDMLCSGCEKRPKGEWIKVKEERMSVDMSGEIVTRYKCSKCGRVIATFPNKLAEYYPFCHCGAKMEGGAE